MNLSQWGKVGLARPAILVFSAVMAWLVARSAIHLGEWYYVLYNADSLYIADFFGDLLHHRDHLSGWRFSPAPNFFPDMAIYGTAALAGAGFRTTIVICTFLQVALFLDACRSLAATARLRGGIAVAVLMVVLVFCYWPFFHRANAFPKANEVYWLTSLGILGNHFGAILASLWGIILLGGAMRGTPGGAAARGLALVALILAAGWSDMLYLVWFCAPAIFCLVCGLGFAQGARLRVAGLILVIAAAGGLTYWLQNRFNPLVGTFRNESAVGWDSAHRSFDFLRAFLFGSGRRNALHAAVFGAANVLLAVYGLVRLIARLRRRDAEPSGHARTLILGCLAASPVACLGAGLVTGMFHDVGMPRYTLPVVFIILAGFGFVCAEAVADQQVRLPVTLSVWIRAVLLAVIPVLGLFLATRHYAHRLQPPPELSCLPADRPLAGLAEYWQARPVTLFGDGRLQVEPLTPDAVPFWWISNRFWFTHRRDRPDEMPLYSFIDMRRLDPVTVERRYGAPSSVVPCPGGDIWFYDDADQLTRRFLEVYAHSAAALDP